jgi:hypothetical protein
VSSTLNCAPETDVTDTYGVRQNLDRWIEFVHDVLHAHHRQGLSAQCVCGSLMVYCPVIGSASRLGLPTEDPRLLDAG